MIRPDKHTDIKYSIVYLSPMILKEIQTNGVIKIDDLKNTLIKKIGNGITEKLEYSLSFLYILNKIEYIEELDSLKTI